MRIDEYINNIELTRKNVQINRRIRVAEEDKELEMLDRFDRVLREIKEEQEGEDDD